MNPENTLFLLLVISFVAFCCEYVDSTLGMGYGTTLTPILLMMGYDPLQIVPVILISELFTGLLAAALHHREGNSNFKLKSTRPGVIASKIRELGYIESLRRGIPRHLKVALLLTVCSIVGTVSAVFIAVSIPKFWVKLYIGVIVLAMGITILVCFSKSFAFSWKKIVGLGLLASFNKGISGGGYGPIVTSGQILAGLSGKSAVGITSLAEGLTCAVGIITYALMSESPLDLRLLPWIVPGAILSVPLSARSVKRINENGLKISICVLTIGLGIYTLWNTLIG